MDVAVRSMKLKSAPGIDQIDYNIISSFPNEYLQLLLQLYNNVHLEGVFPTQWKQSLVVLILKPGTGVRPILLLFCFFKNYGKNYGKIYIRIQWFIESQHIIPDTQLGFRPDRSCIDSLVILTSDIYKGFINNSSTVNAFLDIKEAFDNVVPNILIQDLKNIDIHARIIMFILNLISVRYLHFVIEGNEEAGPYFSLKGPSWIHP